MSESSANDAPARRRRRRPSSSDSELDSSRRNRDDSLDAEYPRRRHRDDRPETSRADSRRHDRPYRRRREYSRSRSRDRLSRSDRRHHSRSRSPARKSRRRSPSCSRSPPTRRNRGPLPSQVDSFRQTADPNAPPPVEKQKPNFKPTGLLAKEANTVAGTTTVLKYHEPGEARRPPSKEPWRVYVFKQKDMLDTLHLHRRSAWLVGRDKKVTDLYLEHPSISKQHAVFQFRYMTSTNEFGDRLGKVKPYLIDLESANGTKLNGKKIDAGKFVELLDADVVTFGDSEREYVLMLPPPD